jgi:hypothetical protein
VERLINSQPSVAELQNQVTATATVVKSIQTQLATNTKQQNLDHASAAEEKDGRDNEKYAIMLFSSIQSPLLSILPRIG